MSIKKDELVVLFIDRTEKTMSLRPMHQKPTDATNEIFMAVIEFKDACVICNRYNNEIAFKKQDKDTIINTQQDYIKVRTTFMINGVKSIFSIIYYPEDRNVYFSSDSYEKLEKAGYSLGDIIAGVEKTLNTSSMDYVVTKIDNQ